MTDFEKIEKLREHANVTFEEAKEALAAANGDLLDAMIWLERRGKAQGPSQSTYSTKYEDQAEYVSVSEKVEETKTRKDYSDSKFVQGLKRIWRFLTGNFFVISREGKEYIVLPLLVMLICLLAFFIPCVIILIVLLFFGFHYSFRGKHNLEQVNETMEKAADAASGWADKVKDKLDQ